MRKSPLVPKDTKLDDHRPNVNTGSALQAAPPLLVERVFQNAGDVWARFTYRMCVFALLALALAWLRELWFLSQATPVLSRPGVA
jgi:hypothetical protein